MKVIVGLGNPGSSYERTRHNAGFMAVDRLARRHAPSEIPRGRFNAMTVEATIAGHKCLLVKPTTFMNRSGSAVAEAVRFFKVDPASDLLVLVDDLALPLGAIRLRPSGGDGGHNGLGDIQRALGSPEYPRLRIGIRRADVPADAGAAAGFSHHDYVLGRFAPDEQGALDAALDRTADAAELFVSSGIAAAMNRFNAPDAPPRPKKPRPTPPDESPKAPPQSPTDHES